MGTLLSPAEIAEARDAMRLVTDQFFITPFVYKVCIDKLNRFGENGVASKVTKAYNLVCMDEYPISKDSYKKVWTDGSEDYADVKLSFNMDYLTEQGLVNGDNSIPFSINDKFVLKGESYNIVMIRYDGPLDLRPVLAIVYGEKDNHAT